MRFLTILPLPGREAQGPGALGRAAWWFPVVGLALGAVLAALDRGLARLLPPLAAAVLLVAVWKALTGGLHLDGLADCLDGLAGGDAARRLAIMRDSRVGVFGVAGLILLLFLSVSALAEIPPAARWRLLLLAPVVGRLMPLLMGALHPAATPGQGSGAAFLGGLPRPAGWLHGALAVALAAWLLGIWGPLTIAAAGLAVSLWSRVFARRLGGLTGDVLGSGVEVGELAVLLAGASLGHGRLI